MKNKIISLPLWEFFCVRTFLSQFFLLLYLDILGHNFDVRKKTLTCLPRKHWLFRRENGSDGQLMKVKEKMAEKNKHKNMLKYLNSGLWVQSTFLKKFSNLVSIERIQPEITPLSRKINIFLFISPNRWRRPKNSPNSRKLLKAKKTHSRWSIITAPFTSPSGGKPWGNSR